MLVQFSYLDVDTILLVDALLYVVHHLSGCTEVNMVRAPLEFSKHGYESTAVQTPSQSMLSV